MAGVQAGIQLSAAESRNIQNGTPSPTNNLEGTRNFNQPIKLECQSAAIVCSYSLNVELNVDLRLVASIFDNVKWNASDSEGTYPINI